MRKDPEFKKMMGGRFADSDGFTYPYGAVRDGSRANRSSNRASVTRAIRADKRGVKADALRREFNENEENCHDA